MAQVSVQRPRQLHSIGASKENVLVDNLGTTPEIIDKFYADTRRYSESLDELVERKYMRAPPIATITESGTTPGSSTRGTTPNVARSATSGAELPAKRGADVSSRHYERRSASSSTTCPKPCHGAP